MLKKLYPAVFVFGLLFAPCPADESKDDDKQSIGDAVGESMKGVGDWFKNAAEEVKEKSQIGAEAAKEFGEQAKEKSESGMDAMKGFAGGIGERFGKVKEKFEESGEKMKEAISNAAEKTKDEFETAGSKISKHAKDASAAMFSLFG